MQREKWAHEKYECERVTLTQFSAKKDLRLSLSDEPDVPRISKQPFEVFACHLL